MDNAVVNAVVNESKPADVVGNGKIVSIEFLEPRSGADGAFDIKLTIESEATPEPIIWRQEFSEQYGRGKLASKTRAEICCDQLARIGWTGGLAIDTLPNELMDKVVPFRVVHTPNPNGGYYTNVYLGGSLEVRMAKDKAMDIIRAIAGGKGAKTQKAAPASFNPFA